MSSCGPVIATGEETGKGQRYRYGEHTAENGYSSAVVKVGCGPVISTGEGVPGIGVGAGYRYGKHTRVLRQWNIVMYTDVVEGKLWGL